MSTFCPTCGAPLKVGGRYCVCCGGQVPESLAASGECEVCRAALDGGQGVTISPEAMRSAARAGLGRDAAMGRAWTAEQRREKFSELADACAEPWQLCPACAAKVAPVKTSQGRRGRVWLALAILVIVAIVAAGVGGWWFFQSSHDLGPEFTNTLGMKFRRIPAGTFTMGDVDQDVNLPHKVTLSHSFYISQCAVTNAQFRQFRTEHDSGSYKGQSLNGDNQPVVHVTWADADAFCQWLGAREHKTYRLPTEAQWEYSCRAGRQGDAGKYPWGPAWPPPAGAGNYADAAYTKLEGRDLSSIPGYDDGFAVAAPVASFGANPWGLYDMGSNVEEWCDDRYDPWFTKLDATDPENHGPENHGNVADGSERRVARGQSWLCGNKYWIQSAYRGYPEASPGGPALGFRVVLVTAAH